MNFINMLEKFNPKFIELFGEREAQGIIRIIEEDYLPKLGINKTSSLSSSDHHELESVFLKVLRGVPVQYAIGKALFFDMKLKVNPSVLIPRPETEELIYEIKDRSKNWQLPSGVIVDVGTGSGCIALGLKKIFIERDILALEKSEDAIKVVRQNAQEQNLAVDVHQFDLLDKSSWETLPNLAGIVSNPPYIPEEEKLMMSENVLAHEPELALFVSNDQPLLFYEKLVELAVEKLQPKGFLAFEINEHFGNQTKELLDSKYFDNVELKKDLSGKDRMLFAIRK